MTAGSVEAVSGGFAVHRNGKTLKTPKGAALIVPSRALAAAMAAEDHLPKKPSLFLQLAATAIDLVAPARDQAIDGMMDYAAGDLICHRAAHPPPLVKQQAECWQPLLDWCAEKFKAPLRSGAGVMPIPQPPKSLQALRGFIADYDAFHLAGLRETIHACGSLVLGLALATRHLTGDAVLSAAELETGYQMKEWGEDPVLKARIEEIRQELGLYQRWFNLLETNN